MDLGGLVLEFPMLDLKGMRILMFQLSGFYCGVRVPVLAILSNAVPFLSYLVCFEDYAP